MKIKQGDYERLEIQIKLTLEKFPLEKTRAEYKERGLSDTRLVWDYFFKTIDDARIIPGRTEEYLFLRSLSDYLNDSHIETALRKIILPKE